MTLSRHPQLTEELLSAYLDNEVTDEERALIETIMAADPAVSWEVESLRQTVHLLQELPALVLPRAFAIEALVAEKQGVELVSPPNLRGAIPTQPTYAQKESPNQWWQSLVQIWQGGNLYLRNAAAVAFTLLIVLFASDQFVTPYQQFTPQPSHAPAQVAVSDTTTSSTDNRVALKNVDTATENAAAKAPVAEEAGEEITVAETAAKEAPIENTAASPVLATAPVVANRLPQDDQEDLSGVGTYGAMAQDQPAAGGDNAFETNPAAAGVSAAAMPNQQAVSPSAATSDNSAGANSTGASSADTDNADTSESQPAMEEATATPATEPIAVSAAKFSMTELAPLTDTVTATMMATGTIMPSIDSSTTVTEDETVNATVRTTNDVDAEHWLAWAQIVTVLFTVVLGSLWWRSRE